MINEMRKLHLEQRAQKQAKTSFEYNKLSDLIIEGNNGTVAQAYAEEIAYSGLKLESEAPQPPRPHSDYLKNLYNALPEREKQKMTAAVNDRLVSLRIIGARDSSDDLKKELESEKDETRHYHIRSKHEQEKKDIDKALEQMEFLAKLLHLSEAE
jgi:predicted RND superfamily exporter protein